VVPKIFGKTQPLLKNKKTLFKILLMANYNLLALRAVYPLGWKRLLGDLRIESPKAKDLLSLISKNMIRISSTERTCKSMGNSLGLIIPKLLELESHHC
jgi:hypothetical protein